MALCFPAAQGAATRLEIWSGYVDSANLCASFAVGNHRIAFAVSNNWQDSCRSRSGFMSTSSSSSFVRRFDCCRLSRWLWRRTHSNWASDKETEALEVEVETDIGDGSGRNDDGVGGGGEGGSGDEGGEHKDGGSDKNKVEALLALASLGRALENIPADLAYAIQDGRVTAAIVERFVELEKAPFIGWLLQFGGFKERLLADDLFLTKVAIECGVGIFTKTAAELERRREKFSKELDFVFADVVMALIADFMLVWLPAPTVSLRPPLAKEAGRIAKFFYNCPDNAFQVAIRGCSYTTLQRFGAILRNGSKLFVVGTSASLIGTAVTNILVKIRRAMDKTFLPEAEDVPVLSTSVAYGVYMAVSSNLRYQILAGVVEQRILEPLLHNQKLALSALCFAVRTGNTFLGSLMWVDYARWVGVQKIRE